MLIKFLRKVLLGCTQSELAARTGIHPNLLSRYERGEVQPASRNLDRLLATAGVLEIRQPLLAAFDHLSDLLSPPPPSAAQADPLLLGDLLRQTSRRLSLGEYSRPIRRDLISIALLTRFLRKILLDCTLDGLSRRTGIHRRVLARYEAGVVRRASPANLDRLLDEARVLHLKEPLLRAMSDLSTLLASPPRPAQTLDLPAGELEAFLAFTSALLQRISGKLYLNKVPDEHDDFLEG